MQINKDLKKYKSKQTENFGSTFLIISLSYKTIIDYFAYFIYNKLVTQ